MAAAALRLLCNIGNKKALERSCSRAFRGSALKKCEHRPGPRKAGRRVCAVRSVLPQAKILAEGQFTVRENEFRKNKETWFAALR